MEEEPIGVLFLNDLQAKANSREKLRILRAPLICGMGEPGHLMLPDRIVGDNSSQTEQETWLCRDFLSIV